jgi:hypothetical protein
MSPTSICRVRSRCLRKISKFINAKEIDKVWLPVLLCRVSFVSLTHNPLKLCCPAVALCRYHCCPNPQLNPLAKTQERRWMRRMERLRKLFYRVFAQQAERTVGKYCHPTYQRRPGWTYAKEDNCSCAIMTYKTSCFLLRSLCSLHPL